MFTKVSFSENPIVIIGCDEDKEKTFNNEKFSSLLEKMKKLESKYNSSLKEKPIDMLIYSIFYPMKINYKHDSKFKISKENLNKIFMESTEKRFHKDIYNSELFELINPYHLVVEKKYINEKYLSESIKANFDKEKENIKEREYNISPNEFYDKKNNIYFALRYNKKKNKDFNLKQRIMKKNDALVKLKNEEDSFEKYLLLRYDFKICELKSLIYFIYKSVFHVENPGKISLYYYNDTFNEVSIVNENITLKELGTQMKTNDLFEIYINSEY